MVAVDLKGGRALDGTQNFSGVRGRAERGHSIFDYKREKADHWRTSSQRGRHTTAVRTVLPSETTARNSEGIPVLMAARILPSPDPSGGNWSTKASNKLPGLTSEAMAADLKALSSRWKLLRRAG